MYLLSETVKDRLDPSKSKDPGVLLKAMGEVAQEGNELRVPGCTSESLYFHILKPAESSSLRNLPQFPFSNTDISAKQVL